MTRVLVRKNNYCESRIRTQPMDIIGISSGPGAGVVPVVLRGPQILVPSGNLT